MKIVIHTLGCKVNTYESDSIAQALIGLGHEVSSELEKADLYIINTCAVTNEAEKKSRQAVSRVLKLNPNANVVITGCASQKNAQQFASLKNVTYVSGVKNKLALISNLLTKKTEIQKHNEKYDENYVPLPSKTRAYVKIQDGCNNFCSYCVIPYLRGRSRSRNIVDILSEVERLQHSAKEIVLTGINITDFKVDGTPALGVLLEQLKNFKVRVRLGSIEETLIDDSFLKVVKEMPSLCPHFHLSLQSGSDSVLKRMNRKYTCDLFAESIKKIRDAVSNPFIATDVIVGFPGETDAEFEQTCNFVKKMKFAYLHIFPYSLREGTPASKMKQVRPDVKKARAAKLEEINKSLQKAYYRTCKNKKYWLLVEEKQGDYYIGHTENYLKCYIKSKKPLEINEFYIVKMKKQYEDGVIAHLKAK